MQRNGPRVAKCAPNVVFTSLQEQRNMRRACNSSSPSGVFRLSTANRLAETENKWEELKHKLSPRDRSNPAEAVKKFRRPRPDQGNTSSDSIELPKNKRTFSSMDEDKDAGVRHHSPDSSRTEVPNNRNFCVMSRFCRAVAEATRTNKAIGIPPRAKSKKDSDELLRMALLIRNGLDGHTSALPDTVVTSSNKKKKQNESLDENSDIKLTYFGTNSLTPKVGGIQSKFVPTGRYNYFSPRNESKVEFRYIKNAKIDLNQVIRGLSNKPHHDSKSIDEDTDEVREDHDTPTSKITAPKETKKAKLLSLQQDNIPSRDHSYSTSSGTSSKPPLERANTHRKFTDVAAATNKPLSGGRTAGHTSSNKLPRPPPTVQKKQKSSKEGFAKVAAKAGQRTATKFRPRKGNMSGRAETRGEGVSVLH